MPRAVWTQAELEKAVPLRYEGHSPLQVAKILTTENLRGLGVPDEVFQALEKINQARKRDTRMYTLMVQVSVVPSVFEHTIASAVQDAFVLAQRLMNMETTERWRTYYDAYEKAQRDKWDRKARSA